MLKIGGIYSSTVIENSVFIYLYKKYNIHYGVNISDQKLDSKKLVEASIYDIQKYNSTYYLNYQAILLEENLDKIADGGYLGEIDKELYDYLLKFLYKSDEWKEWCNFKYNTI